MTFFGTWGVMFRLQGLGLCSGPWNPRQGAGVGLLVFGFWGFLGARMR